MNLCLIHVHSKVFICTPAEAHCCLIKNCIRHLWHLLFNLLNHCCSLLSRKHFQKIKHRHIIQWHCLGFRLGFTLWHSFRHCLVCPLWHALRHSLGHLLFQLVFHLFCCITSGLDSGCHHHWNLKNIFQILHRIFLFSNRIFQDISFFFIRSIIFCICIHHRLLIVFRYKQKQFFHFFCCNLSRYFIFNTALLDSYIYNIWCVGRQGQITIRLHNQNQHDRNHSFPVWCSIFE